MKTSTTQKNNTQKPFSTGEELSFKKKIGSFDFNEEIIEFLEAKLNSILDLDKKLWILFYAKKVLPYIKRTPDPNHYEAFKEDYLQDNLHFKPLKWVESEIEFLRNIKTLGDNKMPNQALLEAKTELSKQWLNRGEIMELLSIGKTTLNRRIAEGMPCHPRGKSNFFNLEEVSEWLKKDEV